MMNEGVTRKQYLAIIGIILVVLIAVALAFKDSGRRAAITEFVPGVLQNISFTADASDVHLVNGAATVTLPETGGAYQWSLLKEHEVIGQFVGSPLLDAAGVVVEETPGTGIFYFVIGFENASGTPKSLTPAFLGDRIDVESVKIESGAVVVETLERAVGDAFAENPTVLNIKRFVPRDGALVLVPQGAEEYEPLAIEFVKTVALPDAQEVTEFHLVEAVPGKCLWCWYFTYHLHDANANEYRTVIQVAGDKAYLFVEPVLLEEGL